MVREEQPLQVGCAHAGAHSFHRACCGNGSAPQGVGPESMARYPPARGNQVRVNVSYLPHLQSNCSLRAALRLILLRITRKPLLSPPIPEREFDPTTLDLPAPSNTSSPTLAPSSPGASPPSTPDHLKNNHEPLPHPLISPPPTRSPTSVEDYLLPKALTTDSVRPSVTLVKTLSTPQEWIAEVIYIIRPLVYGTWLRRVIHVLV